MKQFGLFQAHILRGAQIRVFLLKEKLDLAESSEIHIQRKEAGKKKKTVTITNSPLCPQHSRNSQCLINK